MGKATAQKNSPAAPSAPVSAATLARELGVALEVVTELGAGKTYFTAAERAVIQAEIEERMLAGKIPPPAPDAAVEPAAGELPEDLMLTRVFPWSKNLLANRPNGLEVVVQVAHTRFLKPGMVLPGCIQGVDGWAYYGRLPRILGEAQLLYPQAKEGTSP